MTRERHGTGVSRRSATALSAALLAVVAVGGCIPPRSTPSPSPRAEPTPTPSPIIGTSSSTTTGSVIVDPALLTRLPAAIDGVPLTPDPTTAAEVAGDPAIGAFVSGLAIAAAFRPGADGVDDYVVVTVARVRPGLFGDLFYRGWRDTFDAAVCERAGGVDGHAETDIGGRPTYIGTCAGGVHTYHVHDPTSDVIVSMQGAGPGRFGERVVEGLTE